uniref:C-X-C motif chemokine receptor 5 n=1 Tax=Pipistrellus kuhlii TaxID=59472 RepID=A0A7J7RGC7_PIPKU|nr:C-X-C motif chemokine receptor 5 [Pipistrellus kuhlii]
MSTISLQSPHAGAAGPLRARRLAGCTREKSPEEAASGSREEVPAERPAPGGKRPAWTSSHSMSYPLALDMDFIVNYNLEDLVSRPPGILILCGQGPEPGWAESTQTRPSMTGVSRAVSTQTPFGGAGAGAGSSETGTPS